MCSSDLEGVRVREAGRSAEPGGRRYRRLCVRELHAQDPVSAHARDGRDPGAGGGCDGRFSRRHRPMDLRSRPVRFGGERTAARNDKALDGGHLHKPGRHHGPADLQRRPRVLHGKP